MKTLFTVFFVVFLSSAFSQTFEGEIIYHNSFTSKISALTGEQLGAMIGTVQDYYIKGNKYKSLMNGTAVEWQLYIPSENKLYSKMPNTNQANWNDGAGNPDSVFSTILNKDAIDVLGYRCDELILKCRSGVQKYYFSSKLGVDPKKYINHRFGNWYEFLSRSNALPLKMEIETPQFIMESIATAIRPKKLDDAFFLLPNGIQTQKSPY